MGMAFFYFMLGTGEDKKPASTPEYLLSCDFAGVRMKSRLNLKPGQKGTKKLVEKYGKSLLYVRYRYDEGRGVRVKTVEIVVEEKPWQPTLRLRDEEIVPVIKTYRCQ